MFENPSILFFIVLAIICIIIEMLTLTFYAFFISIGLLLVALFLYLEFSAFIAISAGSLLTIICLIIFQKKFQPKKFTTSSSPLQNLIGQTGWLSEAIASADGLGTVILDGTAWRATASEILPINTKVVVTEIYTVDSMTVVVKQL